MSSQTSPDLSIELIHTIIDEVSKLDRKALIQCCLVSKTFYMVSRQRVWRNLVFPAEHFMGDERIERTAKTCAFLQTPHLDPQIPPLLSIVRTISISLPWATRRFTTNNNQPPTEEHQYTLFGLSSFVRLLGVLDDIARSGRPEYGVHTIDIQCGRPGLSFNCFWSYIWKPVRDAIAQLVTAPTIHTIHMEKVCGVPVWFFRRSPGLRSLTLIHDRFYTGTASLDSVEIVGPILGGAAKVEHLKVRNCIADVSENHPNYMDLQNLEIVPLGTFLGLVVDPATLKSLDLLATFESTATVEHFLRRATRCETLTLRHDIRRASNFPLRSWTLLPSLRDLTLIPTIHLDFEPYDTEAEWDPNAPTEVFIGDEETSVSDALFVPTTFATPERTNVVLRRVTIHRPVHINLPALYPPTSKFTPMGYEYMDVLPTGHVRVSFWEVFAQAVYQIPAVEVEVHLPILVILVNDEFDFKSEDGQRNMKTEADKICREVECAFGDVGMVMDAPKGSNDLPKVQLHVSARFIT